MSARPVVWITRRLSDATLERARRDYDVILDEADTPSGSEAIVAMSERVDAIVPCHSEAFDAATVARLHERLAAAGLDCFVDEPGGNAALAALDNVFLLPHVGSATRATRDAMGFCALDNLDAFFAGRAVPNRVSAG